jgi:dTDP-4-amino-4,6-dideoxygalactose transaminase
VKIPFLDLRRQALETSSAVLSATSKVLTRGNFILGPEVEAFEREWAAYCGTLGAVGVASGTDAITLSLLASQAVRPGQADEVITSPLTAGYTALGIVNAGAVPVFADIDPQSCTLNPETLERAISSRTRAIMPIHLYGRMADMASINAIAARHGLIVIEDAAQAHGATLDGKRSGSSSLAGAFSFYPTKNLGALGDGGIIVSNDGGLLERARLLRQGGHLAGLKSAIPGRNSRLDELQASILRVKLPRLDAWNDARRRIAAMYDELLGEAAAASPRGSHVYHLYVVRNRERDKLKSHLEAKGIETAIHYPYLLHQQPLFERAGQQPLPNAEQLVNQILSIPLYPQLTDAEVMMVARAVVEFQQ